MRNHVTTIVALALVLGGCSSSFEHGVPLATLSPTASATPTPSPSATVPTASRSPQPQGFRPLSTSFISVRSGWFLGTCGSGVCRELWKTTDGGRSFTRLTAPPAPTTEIRFADAREGWAFTSRTDVPAPGLWRTHDGGRHWRRVVRDRAVISLEAARGEVWMVMLMPDGLGPQVMRGSTTGDRLTKVMDVPNRSGFLVLSGDTAYVVGVQGAGPIAPSITAVDSTGAHARHAPPCTGQADRAFDLAAAARRELVAVCFGEPSAGAQRKSASRSVDGGLTWRPVPDPPVAGYTSGPGQLAAFGDLTLLTGSRSDVERERDGGPWRSVLTTQDGAGFTYVGLTDARHGVALSWTTAWLTSDGGTSWRALRFPS